MTKIEPKLTWHRVRSNPQDTYQYPGTVTEYMRKSYSFATVYRWAIYASDRIYAAYVGEADDLLRRLQGYRYPGPTQTTNQRLKALLEYKLQDGMNVFLELLEFEPIQLFRTVVKNPITNPYARKMMENIAILSHDSANCQIWNLTGNPIERTLRRAAGH